MPDPLVQTLTTTGDGIHLGDVITVGGIPHEVADIRELAGSRKRLQFDDGNAYVLDRLMTIEITRTYTSVRDQPGAPRAAS